jgi:serine/threonine protein kinase
VASPKRPRSSANTPFGVPTLPRVDALDALDQLDFGEAEPAPLPPPPVEGPVPTGPELERPVPARDRLVANRYEILEEIGTGGMGTIYQVRHIELGKVFALKIIHGELSENQQARDMFYAEARVASSLDHRNIVSITDYGEDLRRGAFIVMEYLRGEALADRLDRDHRQPVATAVDIIAQTADALAFMHKNGVVHGDIKPENIFLSEGAGLNDRRKNWVKVLDFGLSRLKQARGGRWNEPLTGTPAYLSPERVCGSPPDDAADQYALGVIFYEVLTGAVPFDGNVAQILNAHISTAPTPPSWRLQPGELDERLDEVILTCLAKEPTARFPSVKVFLEELLDLMTRIGMTRRVHTPARVTKRIPAGADCVSMVESNPLPMFAVDPDGVLTLLNQSFCLFVKKEASDLVGHPLADTRLATFCPGILDDLRLVLEENRVTSRELSFKVGREASTVLIWLAPLTVGGIIIGAHGVVHWIQK